jgi:chromosome segregation ATPase
MNNMAACSGSRWTEAETKSLLDAYGEQIIQEAIDGMATNKVVYDEISRILKEHSNIDRTTSQIETKIKKLRSGYSKLKDRMKQSGSERPYFSSALSSVEKTALKVWDQLDRILGKY